MFFAAFSAGFYPLTGFWQVTMLRATFRSWWFVASVANGMVLVN